MVERFKKGSNSLTTRSAYSEWFEVEAAVARSKTPEALLSHLAGLVGDAMHPTQDNYTGIAVYVTQA